MARRAIVVGVALLGVGAGVFSARVARDHPDFSFGGSSMQGVVTLLAAGWLLIASGLMSWLRRRSAGFGLLLTAAGFAWFVLEWNNPAVGSSAAFTIGLALAVGCPPFVAHATLLTPGTRLTSRLERLVVYVAYLVNLVVLGVLPTLLTDPRASGCSECPRDILAIGHFPAAASRLERLGMYGGIAWSAAVGVLLGWKLVRWSSAARRAGWPILAAGVSYFVLVLATFVAWRTDGFLTNATLERRLWLGEAALLVALAAAGGWAMARVRRARFAVARLIVELAQSTPATSLRDVLAKTVGDPELALAYPVGGSERLVDANGCAVHFTPHQDRTSLVREGRTVAVLAHRTGALDDEDLFEEVTRAARLGLEHERLGAEVGARVRDLRASRSRIVAAGDAERRRLERDLHDGAQQRLVGLALSLRLLRSRLPGDTSSEVLLRLEEAAAELTQAIAELRELAHGIFPAVLADEGLAAAVEALAEEGRVPISVRSVPDERFSPSVETAAYMVVAEASRVAVGGMAVNAERIDAVLVIEVETEPGALDLVELEDRVGAVDGRVMVRDFEGGWVTIRAELPCAS